MIKIRTIISIYVALLVIPFACAQDQLSHEFKSQTIQKVNDLLIKNYVFADVAKKTATHLTDQLNSGKFKETATIAEFAQALTTEVQKINHDKHMRFRTAGRNQAQPFGDIGEGGIKESKILPNNIGYLDIRVFLPPFSASSVIDAHMKSLANVDALIIDVRQHRGGSPETVQYLCSYFFNNRIHLNSLYHRITGQTTEYWTHEVEGKKLADIPIYILTSSKTFSAGEEFCYNMQTQKRATLIGETTGGGANPGQIFQINDQLSVFIPTGRAINPVTGTNWEGVGVQPDIAVEAEEALDKTIEVLSAKNPGRN